MPLVPMLQETKTTKEQQKLINQFLEASGYGWHDVLSVSYSTRTFLVRNGGKYRVRRDGTIKRISGPTSRVEDRWEL